MVLRLPLRVRLVSDGVVDGVADGRVVLEANLRVPPDDGAEAAGLGADGGAVAGTTEREHVLAGNDGGGGSCARGLSK